MARSLVSVVVLLQLVTVVFAAPGPQTAAVSAYHSKAEIQALKNSKVTNMADVLAGVDFTRIHETPYPTRDWYDTKINRATSCWAVFEDEQRVNYKLITSNEKPESDLAFLTHRGQCGACSTLKDLAVYIGHPDLTNPVRRCTLKLIGGLQRNCLRNLGFTNECTYIWYHNARNSGSFAPAGGCFGVCIANVFTPNNQPYGKFNPCQPEPDQLVPNEDGSFGAHIAGPGPEDQDTADFCLPCSSGVCCFSARKQSKDGRCGNTINGKQACAPEQYENGPYRLNPCLQCDECRSGPIFQKVAGRTRRNSGLKSEIERPLEVQPIHHNYAIKQNV